MGYLLLILTIIFESTAVIFMKYSNGFQNKMHAGIAVVAYLLSFFFNACPQIPGAGIANAVWAGASTILVAVLGIFLFKEQLIIVQWICLGLIVIGLAGLNVAKSFDLGK